MGGTEHRADQGADEDVWWGLSEESTEHAGWDEVLATQARRWGFHVRNESQEESQVKVWERKEFSSTSQPPRGEASWALPPCWTGPGHGFSFVLTEP